MILNYITKDRNLILPVLLALVWWIKNHSMTAGEEFRYWLTPILLQTSIQFKNWMDQTTVKGWSVAQTQIISDTRKCFQHASQDILSSLMIWPSDSCHIWCKNNVFNLLGRTSGTVTVNDASKPSVLTACPLHGCILMLILLDFVKNKPMETTVYNYSRKGGPTLDLKMFWVKKLWHLFKWVQKK